MSIEKIVQKIINRILLLDRKLKQVIQIFLDMFIVFISFITSMLLRLDSFDFLYDIQSFYILIFITPLTIIYFLYLGLYQAIIRYLASKVVIKIIIGSLISALIMLGISQLLKFPVPRSVPFIYAIIMVIILSSARFSIQALLLSNNKIENKNVLIYGAGEAGILLLNTLYRTREYRVINFIDDSKDLDGKEIGGIKILNSTKIDDLTNKYNINSILLAIPSLSNFEKKSIISKLEKYGLEIQSVPNIKDIISGKSEIIDLKPVSVLDLLSREQVNPKLELMNKNIKNKNILVTGAGGTIGSEIARQIIDFLPNKLILLDISEFSLFKINNEIKDYVSSQKLTVQVIPVLCSVLSKVRVDDILRIHDVQTLFHAAAYKHVPLLEENIIDGVINNVVGTKTILESSIENKVENFTLISTDKAVRPTNIMGASKRISEMVCQSFAEDNNTIISIVRFGNVLESSGSVIPFFKDQIEKGGPVTVTHREITRYFMTIQEAAGLVIQSSNLSKGGEVFVLDMGEPVKILDLAKKMINLYGLRYYIYDSKKENSNSDKDIEIKIIGLRKGEKLYEELLVDDDCTRTQHERIFSANESFHQKEKIISIINDIIIASNKNNIEKIKKILVESGISYNPIKN
ncbi:polysaccharide biosynthesis protein [Pelagibacteraceae bacterium]|nr:polysaccharide biosynthesis protein [Pelagibacteraceae bacterium]